MLLENIIGGAIHHSLSIAGSERANLHVCFVLACGTDNNPHSYLKLIHN